MTRNHVARLAICVALAGAAVPTLGVGPAVPGEAVKTNDHRTISTFGVDRAHQGEMTDPPAPAATPAVDTTSPLGPTVDDDDGSSTTTTVGLGAAACALIAGGFFLRRHGRG